MLYFSEVKHENFTQRIDAEYFKKRFIQDDLNLKKRGFERLESIAKVRGGKRLPLGEAFADVGVSYIRAEDVKNGFVDWEHCPKISNSVYEKIKRYKTEFDDVLITIVGTIGGIGLVKFKLDRCNLTENCVRLISKGVKPEFLFSYLLSKYGQNIIEREKVGTVQAKLAIERINKFKIFKAGKPFQKHIADVVNLSSKKSVDAKLAYTEAEELLLQTLGLANFAPSKANINIKHFSEAFGTARRLDAEYYQPKYEQMVNEIKQRNYDKLSNLVDIQKSIEPGSDNYCDDGLPFIRVSDYDKFGFSVPDKYLKQRFCDENADLINALKPKKDAILFSKDGSVGKAYTLKKNANFITSGAILHLSVKDKKRVIPEYLALVLNAELVQMQAERDAGGSIILHWRIDEIKNVIIPIIDYHKQQEIADLVEKSFALKQQSERLLSVAKTAVDMAIEHDEATAIAFIQNNN